MQKDAFKGQISPLAAGLAVALSEASCEKLQQLFFIDLDKIVVLFMMLSICVL